MLVARCSTAPIVPASSDPCPVLRTLVATALYDRLPPLQATPEDAEATARLNIDLGMVRAQIEESC